MATQDTRVTSPIITGWAPLIIGLANIMALYLFFRGHNAPGGGFVAGIATSISLIFGVSIGRYTLQDPMRLVRLAALGLLIAYATLLAPAIVSHQPILTHTMWHIGPIHIGTAALFDLGVYCVVVGVSVSSVMYFSHDR